MAKTDAQGNIRWAMSGGGWGLDRASRVLCDSQGNIYLAGVIRDQPASFDGILLEPLAGDIPTVFAAKLTPTPPLTISRSTVGATLRWPARANDWVLETSPSVQGNAWTPSEGTSNFSGRDQTHSVGPEGSAAFFRLRRGTD